MDRGSLSFFCDEILGILDPKITFLRCILEILYLYFLFCCGILGILDPKYLFCREILEIFDLD